ncbi:MAG: metallophosphoesterase family protein [Phototrophicaceae bacterium]
MRIAILADIHGNQIGLEAVLAELASKNVDGYWFLGDYCFGGGAPRQVLETITALPNATFIYGNSDKILLDAPYPSAEDLATIDDSTVMEGVLQSWCDLSWTVGALAPDNWLKWLSKLPLDYKTTLPDGTSVLCVHASPNDYTGRGLTPEQRDDEVWENFGMAEEDLIIVGHRHKHQERFINDKHIICVTSIGKNIGKNPRAGYAILESDETGYTVTLHDVEFDTDKAIQQLYDVHFPTPSFLEKFYRGNFVPPWER